MPPLRRETGVRFFMAEFIFVPGHCHPDDELITRYADIQAEIGAWVKCRPQIFRDQTLMLPCDDSESSDFTRFFVRNFAELKLKKLIGISYAIVSKGFSGLWSPTAFEEQSPHFSLAQTTVCGKIFTLGSGDDKLKWNYLESDGDFRSGEVIRLRDAADIIVAHPPTSLLPDFINWAKAGKKKFLILGKSRLFPLGDPSCRLSITGAGRTMSFRKPDFSAPDRRSAGVFRRKNYAWLTNFPAR